MAHRTRHLELKTVGCKNDTSGYVSSSFLKKNEYASYIHQQYLKGFVPLPVVSHLNLFLEFI
jgi:hypothetical protein